MAVCAIDIAFFEGDLDRRKKGCNHKQQTEYKNIDPSPCQHRKYFDANSLREPGANILLDVLVEPIIVRPQKDSPFKGQNNDFLPKLKQNEIQCKRDP